jgi:hypothetical protein
MGDDGVGTLVDQLLSQSINFFLPTFLMTPAWDTWFGQIT